jgi:cytochrome c-type biogenesis protein CcmF
MTPEFGHFTLILAFVVAIAQGVLPLMGAGTGKFGGQAQWIALARPAAQTQFLLIAIAFGCLAQGFLANDFSVSYVAQHSNTQLPTLYRFAAVWGGHEGSLLLWVLMLAGWGAAVSLASRQLPEIMVARVLAVLGLVSIGLLAFILFTSNPFDRLLPAAAEGRDLNPLLQDPGLVFHPPMLYMGYVGFSVAFAFAIAALISGRLDAAWARWSRPWTTAAWVFLTLGIALGQLVGLLRTGLGWLVVLGPGGKRLLHALAGRARR